MTYRSDSDFRLQIFDHPDSNPPNEGTVGVFLFHYPTQRDQTEKVCTDYFIDRYSAFSETLPGESVICFLLDSMSACDLISQLQGSLKYRLWVGIERSAPLLRKGQLPDNHVALVIFTKHSGPFRHSKIQIQYTICPACGKTTKDYGGKKHTYSPYGTLMSDVWRDIKYSEGEYPGDILNRLCYLFAIEPYTHLNYYDLRGHSGIFRKCDRSPKETHLLSRSIKTIKSQLINDDCLRALKNLPDNSIDFAFADPPYNLKKKYDNWRDDISVEEYFAWCDRWIAEVYRVLKPTRTFAILNIPLWLVRHYLFAKDLFHFQDLIVWEGLGLPVRNIMPAHYGIICLSKGSPIAISNYEKKVSSYFIADCNLALKEWYCLRQSCSKQRNAANTIDREPITNIWWDIHRLKHNSKRVDHPCQLPPDLMKRLIFTFTKEGEIVLDPFNGAGTTTLVADLMSRRFLGMELSQQYHRIASDRHIEVSNGTDPFRKQIRTPKAKNSRVQRLEKRDYKVSKKVLQLEVRDIAIKIGRKPTREDVRNYSRFPFEYFEDYFIDWGEVCAAVGDKGMNENQPKHTSNKWEQLSLLGTPFLPNRT